MNEDFSLPDFLPYRLNRLSAAVSDELSAIYVARFGIDIPQWRILANLAARGATTAQAISDVTSTHKATISRAAIELEARGLIERPVAENDRRTLALALTKRGRTLFAELKPAVLAFEAELLDALRKPEREALFKGIAALERVVAERRRAQS